ncbi:19780_t:CDS:2 [Entrophospora sp. SA101]|nr:19780_t:CDS:2 [Entrophospora sp. SA101]
MIPAMLTKKNLSKHTKSLQNNRKREFLEKYLEDQLEAIRTASIDEAGSSASSCTDGLTKIEVPRKKKQLKREPYLFQKSKASVEVQSKHTTNKKAFAGISTSKKGLRTPRFSKHFKQSHSEYSEHLEEGEKKDVKDMEKLEISALYESAFSENKKSATTSQRSCYEIIVVNDSASISSSSSRLTVDTAVEPLRFKSTVYGVDFYISIKIKIDEDVMDKLLLYELIITDAVDEFDLNSQQF